MEQGGNDMANMIRLKDWGLLFFAIDGFENRDVIARQFAGFWNNPKVSKIFIAGKCQMTGKIVDYSGQTNGCAIRIPKDVQFFERVKSEDSVVDNPPHELMCATTVSGEKYYFYSDDHSSPMAWMLADMIYLGELNHRPRIYTDPEFRNPNFS